MSRAYSLDLRERVVASMRGGLSSYEAAKHYQVSQSSAQRWFNRAQVQGSPAHCPWVAAEASYLRTNLIGSPAGWLRRPISRCVVCWRSCARLALTSAILRVWNFVHSVGLSYKKKPTRQRARPSGYGPEAGGSGSVTKARLTPAG